MYKQRIKQIGDRPWEKNFTLRQFGMEKAWVCNDPTGDCKGNARWAETYPPGRIEWSTRRTKVVGGWVEIPIYDFIYDESGGPCMNGEVIEECQFCSSSLS